jgi:threonine aldolase
VDLDRVVTNMVFVDTEAVGLPAAEILDRLAASGVGAVPVPTGVRMVTHVDIDDEGVSTAIDAWKTIAGDVPKEAP